VVAFASRAFCTAPARKPATFKRAHTLRCPNPPTITCVASCLTSVHGPSLLLQQRKRPARSPPTPYEGPDKELLELRQAAVECFILSGKQISPAVALFNSMYPNHGKSTPSRFINEAWALYTSTFSLHTQHNQGRPRAVSDEEAAAAVQILWDGYQADGVLRYYTSIEAACEHSKPLAAMVKEHKCTPRTLLSAMQRVEPKCRSQVQVVKRPHSEENRRQRQRACEQLGDWSISRLQRTCWIDAATIWVVPKDMKVFAPPGALLVTTDPRHPTHSSKVCKMRFYICVNALVGPVALRFITGTTDLGGNEYLVGLASLHTCLVVGHHKRVCIKSPAAQVGRRQSRKQSLLLAACCTAG